ncbi:MAG: hypothetical protein ACI91R_000189, partial [Vicingaceae bacterium]
FPNLLRQNSSLNATKKRKYLIKISKTTRHKKTTPNIRNG